jgi:pimeloyl-ACP methyl ester carboxylesterase
MRRCSNVPAVTGGVEACTVSAMRVLLVHGLGRTPASLWGLSRALREAGHEPGFVGYVAAVERFEAIRSRVRRQLVSAAASGAPYAAVGHSLGGLLVRAALADWPSALPLPARLIMLGTPNRSPRLARRLQRFWPYRLAMGEAGQLLARPAFFAELPDLPVPGTVVAGVRGIGGRWSPFGEEPNDGIVALSETRPCEGVPVVEVPAAHAFLMNHPAVRRLVTEALRDTVDARPETR